MESKCTVQHRGRTEKGIPGKNAIPNNKSPKARTTEAEPTEDRTTINVSGTKKNLMELLRFLNNQVPGGLKKGGSGDKDVTVTHGNAEGTGKATLSFSVPFQDSGKYMSYIKTFNRHINMIVEDISNRPKRKS